MSLRHDRARVAISLAQHCISDLIESYKAKCAEAEDYDQVTQQLRCVYVLHLSLQTNVTQSSLCLEERL